ncbi:MAG: AmmeMemoRadiSam system protein B [Candidatus Omnitrophica bacterium]|nr:AmmeMemoRadiSam system protein B [Candidatus Omnitrophota bacterium]
MLREPQVAGQFYPAAGLKLKQSIDALVSRKSKKEEAFGLVAPHAGYMFSGAVAGACFSRVKLTKTVIIIGPNHTGRGAFYSIMTEGAWKMPMGDVQIDQALAEQIARESRYLEKDHRAHAYEHSIEVQLPFLQYFMPEVKIVPIVLSGAEFKIYDEIGQAIAKATKTHQKALIVASSDMTHYEPHQRAKQKDQMAINEILKLDPSGLLKLVEEQNITMCGYGPVACMLSASKELGAKKASLIKYQTSGEAGGDYSSVVGYAGIIVQ